MMLSRIMCSSRELITVNLDDFYGNGEVCGTELFEEDDPEYIKHTCLEVAEV